jgi:hypothetical protein
MIPNAAWAKYKKTINDISNDFNKAIIVWHRYNSGLQYEGEDKPTISKFTDINLDCLISYNYFRTWPITENTKTGSLDKESMVVIFNKDYLYKLGYVNANKNFDINPGQDYFTFYGVDYQPSGETPVSQAKDQDLLFWIILKRRVTQTGNPVY